MVMWTTTHCFDFFHVILCKIVSNSQYVQNYRPTHEQTNIRPPAKILFSHITLPGGGYYY